MDSARRHRSQPHASKQHAREPIELRPRVVAVFRLVDDTVCHTRCGRPLAFHGVRALIEADFYCYACLAHVTIPVAVLDTLPVATSAGHAMASAAL